MNRFRRRRTRILEFDKGGIHMKKVRICILFAIAVCILLACVIVHKWDAIFQRGNPIPYLAAAVRLSDENPFEAVENMEGIYITRRGEKQDLFRMIQDTYDAEFKDQIGSGYLFSDGEKNYIVGSEIYWGRFTVWTLSFGNGFPGG